MTNHVNAGLAKMLVNVARLVTVVQGSRQENVVTASESNLNKALFSGAPYFQLVLKIPVWSIALS